MEISEEEFEAHKKSMSKLWQDYCENVQIMTFEDYLVKFNLKLMKQTSKALDDMGDALVKAEQRVAWGHLPQPPSENGE